MSELSRTPSPEYKKLREKFHDHPQNYELLRGERQAVQGRPGVWDDDYLFERYLHYTDKVIGMMDGSVTEREHPSKSDPEYGRPVTAPDAVVWLDKSARPVSWFTDAFWEQFAQDGAEKPENEFLNIDRTNWFVRQGHDVRQAETVLGPNDFDINMVSDEDIARIRAALIDEDIDPDNWQNDVWNKPTRLDGKEVLIIDEVKNKGGTLKIAFELLRKAVPEAKFSADYFMKSGVHALNGRAEEQQMNFAPLWYDDKDAFGRGVGDPSKTYYEQQYEKEPTNEHLRKALAWTVLSAPHHDPKTFEEVEDIKAQKLQQDIAFLTYGYGDGRIFRHPDPNRDFDQLDEIYQQQGITLGRGQGKSGEYLERRRNENSGTTKK